MASATGQRTLALPPRPTAGAGPAVEIDVLAREAAARLARVARLRRELGLNYAGANLACELLARIDELEARSWTRTS